MLVLTLFTQLFNCVNSFNEFFLTFINSLYFERDFKLYNMSKNILRSRQNLRHDNGQFNK